MNLSLLPLPTTGSVRTRRGMRTQISTNRQLLSAVANIRGGVSFDVPLKNFTSLKIGGPADVFVTPADLEDLCVLVSQSNAIGVPVFPLGGTNVLVQDRGIRGVVVSFSQMMEISDEGQDVLYAEAGVRMPVLMQYAINRSLSGLEWAAGIPGTVGGGVVMNAGTHLGEMKDALKAFQFVTLEGQPQTLEASTISFSYRRASLPPGFVAGAWFQLTHAPKAKVRSATRAYLQYRKATQPLTRPNAGSIFKNPKQSSAGELIEKAGLKGIRIGDAQVSQKHANFIINVGQARATDVLLLIKKIQQTVFQQTGVNLELELQIVGDP